MPQPFKSVIKDGVVSCYVQLTGPRTFRVVKMALDTGATYTIVSPETIIAIGYNPTVAKKHIDITTASGLVIVPVIKIKSLACFGKEIKNIEVVCHDLPSQSPVKGLLGLNFLIHFPPFQRFLEQVQRL